MESQTLRGLQSDNNVDCVLCTKISNQRSIIKNKKYLLTALLLACSFSFCMFDNSSKVFAEDVKPDKAILTKDPEIPTLDFFEKGDGSYYTLEPSGEARDKITKYEVDGYTAEPVPVFVNVETHYGTGTLSQKDYNEVNFLNGQKLPVTYHYDSLNSFSKSDSGYSGVTSNRREIKENVSIRADFIDCSGGAALQLFNYNYSLVNGTFINNKRADNSGGAFSNYLGTVKELDGIFIYNYGRDGGGAFENNDNATIDLVKGLFIGNYSGGNGQVAGNGYGGAIYNKKNSHIGTIYADFIGNSAYSAGAIMNGNQSDDPNTKIDNIYGDFIGNNCPTDNVVHGGAIQNRMGASIGNIVGDFIDNVCGGGGGAIANVSTNSVIKNITANFFGNIAGQGGAITNEGTINSINGNFIKNKVIYENSDKNLVHHGGAINNINRIDSITGTFIGNYTANYIKDGVQTSLGGAIYNSGIISKIVNSSFIDNYSDGTGAKGGAIYTTNSLEIIADGSIENGTSDVLFDGNWAGSKDNLQAIYVAGDNKTITLTAKNKGSITFNDKIGGGSYNLALTGDNRTSTITLNNLVTGTGDVKASLENDTLILGLTGEKESNVFRDVDFTGISGLVTTSDGTIANYNVKSIKSTKPDDEDGNGTYTSYAIDMDIVNVEEKTDENGNTIYVGSADTFTVDDTSKGYLTLSSLNIKGVENDIEDETEYVVQIIKGAKGNLQLDDTRLDIINHAQANMKSSQILAKGFGLTKTEYENDSLYIIGWRDNLAAWAELEVDPDQDKVFEIVAGTTDHELTRNINTTLQGQNLTIVGESKESSGLDLGGFNLLSQIGDTETPNNEQSVTLSNFILKNSSDIKVNENGSLTLDDMVLENSLSITNNNELKVTGEMDINNTIVNNKNMTIGSEEKTSDINITGSITSDDDASLTITNSNILIDEVGTITSTGTSSLNIKDSTVDIYGTVANQKIAQSGENTVTTLHHNAFKTFTNNSLTMGSNEGLSGGEFNIPSLGDFVLNFNELNMYDGTINIGYVDVNLTNKTMGRITSSGKGEYTGGNIVLNDMIVSGDSNLKYTNIQFADEYIAEAVQSHVKGTVWGDIYEYGVSYAPKANSITGAKAGDFTFERLGFNPAIEVAPAAQLTGGYAGILQVYEYAFEHADTFASLPLSTRKAMQNANKYAINENNALPTHYNQLNSKGLWTRSYASFESIPLKNGPKVSTILYGTMVGGDSEIKTHKNGWNSVFTAYAAYNGSTQNYSGNHTYQNGGAIGVTETFYKNNFYTALTASAGASVGDTNTRFGHEDFAMLIGGVASRSGYNWEFKEGKFIIQPTLLMSYTFINTFDYTNAAGVRVESDPLHALQVHPSVKFVLNSKNGWQPYLAAGFVYNVMGQTQFRANDITLPSLSIKPYAEYGLGLQKFWGDKFTGFAQAMVRSGGRNGIALTFGFRWAIGRDDNKTVNSPSQNKKIIKQL